MSMAKEVASRQSSIRKQVELKLQKETADKINFESQASFMLSSADQQMNVFESIVEQSQAKTAEYSILLVDSVGVVYALEEEK
ncbi:MAG: hypothetical protein ACKPKO_53645 [Candidatus Fonsibacter sp.]